LTRKKVGVSAPILQNCVYELESTLSRISLF
jgi:hypothetical protein